MKISIPPKKVSVILCIIVLFLTIASVTGQYYKMFVGADPFILKIVDKLDLDLESNNLPTWYQSSTLLLCSFLLLIIALIRREVKDKYSRFWGMMALGFLYLSMDEAVAIHEQITVPLRHALDAHGIFFFSWVIPIIILIPIALAISFKFLKDLPSWLFIMFVVAGVIYLSGALGMEMIGASYYEKNIEPFGNTINFTYCLLTTFEEVLEMSGMIVFIYALTTYLTSEEIYVSSYVKEKSDNKLDAKLALGKSAVTNLNTK